EGERRQGRRAGNGTGHGKSFAENQARPARAEARPAIGLNQAKAGGPVLGGSGEAMPGAKPSEGIAGGAGSTRTGAAGSAGASGTIGATASAPHGQCCCPSPSG